VSSTPTTSNQTADAVNSVIHSAIFTLAVNAAETELLAAFPVLNFPVIKQLQNLIVQYIAGKIYDALSTLATFQIIDVQVNSEAAATQTAISNLKTAIESGNENAISKAKNDFSQAFANLIHYDGSSTH
jgi:hypothetical protein